MFCVTLLCLREKERERERERAPFNSRKSSVQLSSIAHLFDVRERAKERKVSLRDRFRFNHN